MQRDRLRTIDAEIATRRRKFDSLAEQIEDTYGEAAEAIMRRMKEHEATIASLQQERENAVWGPTEGLTDQDAATILAFAETGRIGMADATPAEWRQLCQMLLLHGRVLRILTACC